MLHINDDRLRSIMDETLKMAEAAHQLMVDLSMETGYYRKRVCDVTTGDIVGVGANEWLLVADIVSTCTPEGVGVYEITFVEDARTEIVDPADIVDVKAEPDMGGF